MEQEYSQIIGKTIYYSVSKEIKSVGVVVDKVTMKEKPSDPITITGYMIKDRTTNQLICISYWRVLELVNEEVPKGNLPGGYVRN